MSYLMEQRLRIAPDFQSLLTAVKSQVKTSATLSFPFSKLGRGGSWAALLEFPIPASFWGDKEQTGVCCFLKGPGDEMFQLLLSLWPANTFSVPRRVGFSYIL